MSYARSLVIVVAVLLQIASLPGAAVRAANDAGPAPVIITPNVRYDPYRPYRARLTVDGRLVATFSGVGSGIRIARKTPGRDTYDAITLERGVTQDAAFQQWADTSLAGIPSAKSRPCTIDTLDGDGKPVQTYTAAKCWISEYQSLPNLGAQANAVAIQHIKLEAFGWTRVR